MSGAFDSLEFRAKKKNRGEELLEILKGMSNRDNGSGHRDEDDIIGSDIYSSIDETRYELYRPIDLVDDSANIVIVGVGGAGCNMVNTLYELGVVGAKLIAINTDEKHLRRIHADKKVLIGKSITKGNGAGGSPELGRACAETDASLIAEALGNNPELVFIAAGMGGGTGTGAAPVVAKISSDKGAKVMAVVTLPFKNEGRLKMKIAKDGIKHLRKYAHSVVLISNEKLLNLARDMNLQDAFRVGDYTLAVMVKGIAEIINKRALMNVDLQDVKNIMAFGGVSAVGIGESSSPRNRAIEAVKMALENQLIDVNPEGARGALIVVTGGPNMKLAEIDEIARYVTQNMDPDALIKIGADVDENFGDRIRVILLLSGIRSQYILPGEPRPTPKDVLSATPFSPSVPSSDGVLEMIEEILGGPYVVRL